MKYSEARQGRTFIIRLDTGDLVVEGLKQLAMEENIRVASIIMLGAVESDVALRTGSAVKPDGGSTALTAQLNGGPHEVAGCGRIAWGAYSKEPEVHLHLSCGHGDAALTGCVGEGFRAGYTVELFITELVGTDTVFGRDPDQGKPLLIP